MLDTGMHVTIIACSEWPVDWELEPVAELISVIEGVVISWHSKGNIIVGGPEVKVAAASHPSFRHQLPCEDTTSWLRGETPSTSAARISSWGH